MLVGNLVSGALWLLPLLFSPALFVIGVVYVVGAGAFLGAVYGRGVSTMKQEALAWVAPWLVAVALWTVVLATGGENTMAYYLTCLGLGTIIATGSYLAWQVVALAVRQVIAWRSGRSTLPA